MKDLRKPAIVITLIIIACSVMAFIDAIISPDYFVKSAIKLVLFVGMSLLYAYTNKDASFLDIFRPKEKKGLLVPILLGSVVYVFIMAAYFIIGPYFDFSKVTSELVTGNGIRKENYIPVAIYISLVNSFLEELFFRGFAFFTLKRLTSRRFAYLFSAMVFSLYHIAIMSSWFSVPLFLLLLVSLFIAGLMFHWLNEKRNTIYTSWLVHMCANFAINTVGFILYGII